MSEPVPSRRGSATSGRLRRRLISDQEGELPPRSSVPSPSPPPTFVGDSRRGSPSNGRGEIEPASVAASCEDDGTAIPQTKERNGQGGGRVETPPSTGFFGTFLAELHQGTQVRAEDFTQEQIHASQHVFKLIKVPRRLERVRPCLCYPHAPTYSCLPSFLTLHLLPAPSPQISGCQLTCQSPLPSPCGCPCSLRYFESLLGGKRPTPRTEFLPPKSHSISRSCACTHGNAHTYWWSRIGNRWSRVGAGGRS